MKAKDVNKIIVIIGTAVLLLFLHISSMKSECFKPLQTLFGYGILIYDIVAQIYFLLRR